MATDDIDHHEREAEAARLQLAETLDELSLRLTPSNMVDDVKQYARDHMMEPAKNYAKDRLSALATNPNVPLVAGVAYAVRKHPVPALLIGAGAYMLWRNGSEAAAREERLYRHPAYRQADRFRDEDDGYARTNGGAGIAARVRETAEDLRHRASETASEAASNVRDYARQGREQAASTVQAARETVSETATEAYERAADYADYVGQRASEMADDVASRARRTRRRVRSSVETMVEEQPMAVLAVGLLAGAALGALLPRTRVEADYLGETARDARRRAEAMARSTYRKAKNAASTFVDELQDEAHREGVDPEGLSETAADLGRRVRSTVKNAARQTREKVMNDDSPMQQAAGQDEDDATASQMGGTGAAQRQQGARPAGKSQA